MNLGNWDTIDQFDAITEELHHVICELANYFRIQGIECTLSFGAKFTRVLGGLSFRNVSLSLTKLDDARQTIKRICGGESKRLQQAFKQGAMGGDPYNQLQGNLQRFRLRLTEIVELLQRSPGGAPYDPFSDGDSIDQWDTFRKEPGAGRGGSEELKAS